MNKKSIWWVVAAVMLWSSAAQAADYKRGPNAFAFHIGGQGGFVGWAPGGAKLFFEYNRRLSGRMWLDLELNPVFGDRWGDRDCWYDPDDDTWHCRHWHYRGSGVELFGGVKWRFYPVRAPFVPYARVGGILVFLSYPDHVMGFALAVRGGGGFKFFVIKNFGIGLEAMPWPFKRPGTVEGGETTPESPKARVSRAAKLWQPALAILLALELLVAGRQLAYSRPTAPAAFGIEDAGECSRLPAKEASPDFPR